MLQRQLLYLGEIHDRERRAQRRTIEVFVAGQSLFAEDRPVQLLKCDVVQVKFNGPQVRRPRQWGVR